jgi:cyclase
LIDATQQYIRALMRPELRGTPLRELLAEPLAAGSITYFEPYEAVHQANLETVGA